MVILYNPDTKKYYIAPSPPSFYESPSTPTSSDGFSSVDPTINTNPEFDRNIGGITIPGTSSGTPSTPTSSDGFSSVDPTLAKGKQISAGEYTQLNQLGQKITPGKQTTDFNKGYFGGVNPNIQERGVLTVGQKEANIIKSSGRPYWLVESETPTEAIQEGSFAGSTPQIYRNLNTRSLYEYNFQNILAGKQTYKYYKDTITEFKTDPQSFEGREGVIKTESEGAFTYQLTPEYFDKTINFSNIQQSALIEAKTQFGELPKTTRYKLNVAGYGQGVSSAVLGIGEFSNTLLLNMGVQTSNKEGVFEKRSFKFGGTLGEIRNYPSTQSTVGFLESPGGYLKQKGTAPDILGQATVIVPLAYQGVRSLVTNIKTFGVAGGITETIGSASPFKLKPGVYSQPITKTTKFTNIKSLKGTSNGITTKIYTGSSGNIKLTGVERSAILKGKTVGGGYTVTRTPYIQISPGGRITTGTRTTLNPYTFGSGGSGSVYGARGNQYFTQVLTPSYKGGTSTIISSKGITAYTSQAGTKIYSNLDKAYKLTGGSASNKINTGVKDFISGKATPQYKTIYSGDTRINLNTGSSSRDFIHSPTGKYKLTPQLSGREYDLNAILGGQGNKGYTSFKGSGGSGLKTIYKFDTGGIKAVVQTPTPATAPIYSKVIPFTPSPKLEAPQSSQYSGLGMYEQTIGGTSPKLIQLPKVNTELKVDVISAVIPQVKTDRRSGGRSKTIITPAPAVIQKPKIDTIQTPKVIQVRRVKLQQPQSYARPTSFTYGGVSASFTPYNVPPPVPKIPLIPMLAGGGSSMILGNVRPQRSPISYTPSFKALFFKIKGQAPRRKVKTGLGFRPITPGFSFTKRRTIKVRRVKL